jgi:hypothetical protein
MMASTEEFRIREGLIHRSTWKGNSANFAFTEFYEVRTRKSGAFVPAIPPSQVFCYEFPGAILPIFVPGGQLTGRNS